MTDTQYSKEDIYLIIKEALISLFEINEQDIKMEADLYQDLDIDSIDAIDLVVHLKDRIGKKPDVESFKNSRTVGDVVEVIYALVNK